MDIFLNNITDDLLWEILQHCPLTLSVLQVCKRWYLLYLDKYRNLPIIPSILYSENWLKGYQKFKYSADKMKEIEKIKRPRPLVIIPCSWNQSSNIQVRGVVTRSSTHSLVR